MVSPENIYFSKFQGIGNGMIQRLWNNYPTSSGNPKRPLSMDFSDMYHHHHAHSHPDPCFVQGVHHPMTHRHIHHLSHHPLCLPPNNMHVSDV